MAKMKKTSQYYNRQAELKVVQGNLETGRPYFGIGLVPRVFQLRFLQLSPFSPRNNAGNGTQESSAARRGHKSPSILQ